MKVEVKDGKKQEEIEYPCLMIGKDGLGIVLFLSKATGVLLRNGGEWDGCFISESWEMDAFIPFTGSITLSND